MVENRHWTDALFSLRVEAPRLAFQAGQFVRIALEEQLARPFSFVNPPQDPVLEFYGIVVPEGPLSPRLARLRAGDRLLVAINPAGFLVLSRSAGRRNAVAGVHRNRHRAVSFHPAHRNAVAALPQRGAGSCSASRRELVYREMIRKISKERGLRT